MMQTTIETTGYMGKPWTISGDLESGLMIHKMGKAWVVTHAASGLGIGIGCKVKRDSIAMRNRLFAILPDWTAPDLAKLAKQAGFRDNAEFARAIKETGIYRETVA